MTTRRCTLALAASLVLLGAAAKPSTPPLILSPNWTAHYSFDTLGPAAEDVSKPRGKGESKHPAQSVGARLVTPAVRGKAARLDGKSYLVIPDFPGGRGFTIAAWVRTTHAAGAQYILAKGNNLSGSFYLRLQDGGRPRTGFLPIDDTTIFIESKESVNDGKWRHVAGVLDGRELLLYVDGRLDRKAQLHMPFTVTVPRYERFTYIGAFDVREDDGKPDAAFFRGDLDELRLLDCAVPAETIANWASRQ